MNHILKKTNNLRVVPEEILEDLEAMRGQIREESKEKINMMITTL